jgi:hypothetical protein
MTPQASLSSTAHVLADTNPAKAEYLVYAPSGGSFSLNLSGNRAPFIVEWMNPATGIKSPGANVTGGRTITFVPAFNGDAVLYLKQIGPASAQRQ